MTGKFNLKILNENMEPIIGVNGKEVISSFDILYNLEYEVEYVLNQIEINPKGKYHLVINSVAREECNLILHGDSMSVKEIMGSLKVELGGLLES